MPVTAIGYVLDTGGAGTKDGLDKTAEDLKASIINWPLQFQSDPWMWNGSNAMPSLKKEDNTAGTAVPWPSWLIDPSLITIAFNPASLVPHPELENVIISDVIQIHHSQVNGPTSATITVSGSFSSIEWYYNGFLLSSTNTVTLNAANELYNMIDAPTGEKFLTMEVMSGGTPYNRTILFRVRP